MDVAQHDRRIQTICVLILTGIAIAAALYFLRPVMVPFVLAVFLALTLSPLVELQRRIKIPRMVGVVVALLFAFFLLLVLGSVVSGIVSQIMDNADLYQRRVERVFEQAEERVPFLSGLSSIFETPSETFGGVADEFVVSTATAVLGILSDGILVLIFVFFLLIGSFGTQEDDGGVWNQVELNIKRYVFVKLLLSGATGIVVAAIFIAIGNKLALAFGLFAFILNFIPNVGSIIATLLPLPMVLFSPETTVATFAIAVLGPGSIQFVIGNLLEPKLLGGSMDLHPISVLLALIFWGMLWGLVGMLLAVPMTAAVKIVLEKVDLTAPFANALAGRFGPLPAVEKVRCEEVEDPAET